MLPTIKLIIINQSIMLPTIILFIALLMTTNVLFNLFIITIDFIKYKSQVKIIIERWFAFVAICLWSYLFYLLH